MKLTNAKNNPYAVQATRVVLAGALAITSVAGFMALGGSAGAQQARTPVAFSAEASSSVGYFNLLDMENVVGSGNPLLGGQTRLASVELGSTTASTNSEVENASHATAEIGKGNIGPFSFADIAPTSVSSPVAGPSAEESLLDIDLSPFLSLGLMQTSANTAWEADQCAPADNGLLPLATASSDAGHFTAGDFELPGLLGSTFNIGALLDINDNFKTTSTTQLVELEGSDDRAIQSIATANGTTINVTDYLGISIGNDWSLSATADGKPGGASVQYDAPTVAVTFAGAEIEVPRDGTPIVLNTDGFVNTGAGLINQIINTLPGSELLPDFDPGLIGVIDPSQGLVQFEIALENIQEDVAADGTHASAAGSLLSFKMSTGSSSALLPEVNVVDTALFPLSVEASMAEGGLNCGPLQSEMEQTEGETLPETGENMALYALLAGVMVAAGATLVGGYALSNRRGFFGRK